MTDWTTEALSIYEDFKAEGFAITVRAPGSEGVWNPTTMAYTGATEATDYTTYGIKKNYSIRNIDGTIIQQGDTMLLFPAYGASGALPVLGSSNQILIGSVVQNVVNIEIVDPGNMPLLYKAQIRS